MEKQPLLNTYTNNCTFADAVEKIESCIVSKQNTYVVFINVDVVMKIEHDPYLKQIVDDANMVLVDGMPLVWIAKMHGRPVVEKISGSDLVPALCERAAEKGYTVFILGGKEGAAEKAKSNLEQKYPGIKVVGTYAPAMGFDQDPEELEKGN